MFLKKFKIINVKAKKTNEKAGFQKKAPKIRD